MRAVRAVRAVRAANNRANNSTEQDQKCAAQCACHEAPTLSHSPPRPCAQLVQRHRLQMCSSLILDIKSAIGLCADCNYVVKFNAICDIAYQLLGYNVNNFHVGLILHCGLDVFHVYRMRFRLIRK